MDDIITFYKLGNQNDPQLSQVSPETWLRFVAQPENRNGRDFRFALLEGRLVGIATSALRDKDEPWVRHFRIIVDVAYRRNRIGTALLYALTHIDPPSREVIFQTLCPENWNAGLLFLRSNHFCCIEREIEMVCTDLKKPIRQYPSGLKFERSLNPESLASKIAAIHNQAYRDTLSFVPYTNDGMATILSHGGELWIGSLNGKIIGYCHIDIALNTVWLESVAVKRQFRSRGVGTHLILRALESVGLGRNRVGQLLVDEMNFSAKHIYTELGFKARSFTQRLQVDRRLIQFEEPFFT